MREVEWVFFGLALVPFLCYLGASMFVYELRSWRVRKERLAMQRRYERQVLFEALNDGCCLALNGAP